MSNIIQFDYDAFYNYYTNDSNLEKDNSKLNTTIWYYLNAPYKNQPPIDTILSNKYIIINNTKLYIKKLDSNKLLFTIPTLIENKLWDFHYHFGQDNLAIGSKKTKVKKTSLVFFHKTIQDPSINGKYMNGCYYHSKMQMNMDNFEDIKCLQRKYHMKELYTPEDLIFIKEIISRPFITQTAGKSRKTRRNRKRRVRKTNRFIQKKKYNI